MRHASRKRINWRLVLDLIKVATAFIVAASALIGAIIQIGALLHWW